MNFKHSNTNETIIETQPYNQEKENERTELFTKSRRSFIWIRREVVFGKRLNYLFLGVWVILCSLSLWVFQKLFGYYFSHLTHAHAPKTISAKIHWIFFLQKKIINGLEFLCKWENYKKIKECKYVCWNNKLQRTPESKEEKVIRNNGFKLSMSKTMDTYVLSLLINGKQITVDLCIGGYL